MQVHTYMRTLYIALSEKSIFTHRGGGMDGMFKLSAILIVCLSVYQPCCIAVSSKSAACLEPAAWLSKEWIHTQRRKRMMKPCRRRFGLWEACFWWERYKSPAPRSLSHCEGHGWEPARQRSTEQIQSCKESGFLSTSQVAQSPSRNSALKSSRMRQESRAAHLSPPELVRNECRICTEVTYLVPYDAGRTVQSPPFPRGHDLPTQCRPVGVPQSRLRGGQFWWSIRAEVGVYWSTGSWRGPSFDQ